MSESIIPQKICTKCKISKPLTDFPVESRNKKDGRNARCKTCCNAYNGEYHANHRHNPVPISEKTCSHCKRILSIDRFFKDPLNTDGYCGVCIGCKNEHHRNYEEELALGIRPHKEISEKRCYRCKKVRPIVDFHISNGELDGHRDICKFCQAPIGAAWREKDLDYFKRWRIANRDYIWEFEHTPERIRRRNELRRIRNAKNPYKHRKEVSVWQKRKPDVVANIQHRRRAKKRGLAATFTVKDRQIMLSYWNNCCAYCGQPVGFWHFLAEEHFIAESNGGPYTPDNILPACHARKGAPGAMPDTYCNNSKSDNDPEEWLIQKLGTQKAKQKLEEIRIYFEWVIAPKETSNGTESSNGIASLAL